MGNYYLLQDLIRIVTNKADDMHERYFSGIKEASEKIQLDVTPKKKKTPVSGPNE